MELEHALKKDSHILCVYGNGDDDDVYISLCTWPPCLQTYVDSAIGEL